MPESIQSSDVSDKVDRTSVEIVYREELNVLFVKWLHPTNEERMQRGYWRLLHAAENHCAVHWLLDVRERGPGDRSDYWVLDVFLPNALSVMGEELSIAYFLVPSHYRNVVPRVPIEQLKALSPRLSVQMFTSEREAIRWLRQKQNKP